MANTMGRINFQATQPKNGLITLSMTDFNEATRLANVLFSWKITDLKGTSPRQPIKQRDLYCLHVTEAEYALIQKYYLKDHAPPETEFAIFSPEIIAAADVVRTQFLTHPYRGAINPKLDKKDYDEWQTVEFYSPPSASYSEQNGITYRTQISSVADEIVSLLKKEQDEDKSIEVQYEIKIEEREALFDPSSGYMFSTLTVDSLDNLEHHPIIHKWKKKAKQEVDPRFLAIQCQNGYYLYGKDREDGIYKILNPIEALAPSVKEVLKLNTPSSTLQKIKPSKEIEKDLIKYGKCYAHHPSKNALKGKKIEDKQEKVLNALQDVLAITKPTSLNYTIEKTLNSDEVIYCSSQENADKFIQNVHKKLSEETKTYFSLSYQKQYCIKVNDNEQLLIENRLPQEYVVRPNHGFTHSMRVATFVPCLVQHFKRFHPTQCQSMNEIDVRLLQIAMLFSVVGRETEIGFGSQDKYYQLKKSYKLQIEKLKKEKIGLTLPKDQKKIDQIDQKIVWLTKLKNDAIEKYKMESQEYFTYRKSSALAFLAYCQQSGFDQKYCSATNDYVNIDIEDTDRLNDVLTHLDELGLLPNEYDKFGNRKMGDELSIVTDNGIGTYSIKLPTLHYHTLLLYKMSDPYYSEMPDGFARIIALSHGLDLLRCYPKIANSPGSFSTGGIIQRLSQINSTPECNHSAKAIAKFAEQSLIATGERRMCRIDDNFDVIDCNIPPDFSRKLPASTSTSRCIDYLNECDASNTAYLAKTLGYDDTVIKSHYPILKIAEKIPSIVTCERNQATPTLVKIYFDSEEDARLFCELMVESNLLDEKTLNDWKNTKTVTVSKRQFDAMQGYVTYQHVRVPKEHNTEETLLTEDGNFRVLKLIESTQAIGKHINVGVKRDIDFHFKQLDNPVEHHIPSDLYEGAPNIRQIAFERQLMMNMIDKTITDSTFNLQFQLLPINYDIEHIQSYYDKQIDKMSDPKNLLVFFKDVDIDDDSRNVWYCCGKDASGQFKLFNTKNKSDLKTFKSNMKEHQKTMAVHFGYYKILSRGLKDYLPLDKQMPIDEKSKSLQSTPEDFVIGEGTAKPISTFTDRGKPKNTLYTSKQPGTLIRPDGKTRFFDNPDWDTYLPVGILYDSNKVHLRGERYIWAFNSLTKQRSWIGKRAQQHFPDPTWGRHLSFHELQETLNRSVKEHEPQSLWNELLVGYSKTAIQGLFIQDDYTARRLSMLTLYLQIRKEHGIDVPLFIINGKSKPFLYSERKLREDLIELFECIECDDLWDLFEKKNPKMQHEIMDDLLGLLDYEVLEEDYPLIEQRVDAALKSIKMIGGYEREKNYYVKHWVKNDPQSQLHCYQRARAFGHPSLIHALFKKRAAEAPQDDFMQAFLQDQENNDEMNVFASGMNDYFVTLDKKILLLEKSVRNAKTIDSDTIKKTIEQYRLYREEMKKELENKDDFITQLLENYATQKGITLDPFMLAYGKYTIKNHYADLFNQSNTIFKQTSTFEKDLKQSLARSAALKKPPQETSRKKVLTTILPSKKAPSTPKKYPDGKSSPNGKKLK